MRDEVGKGIKMKKPLIQILLMLAGGAALGQGFIYDQQSATSDSGGQSGAINFYTNDVMGQAFVPSLSSVGFVRLSLADLGFGSGAVGATVYMNLWADSIGTGTLLDSTAPIYLPVGFNNYVNFIFSTPATVTPGTTYFFQPVSQTGDLLNLGIAAGYAYESGYAIFDGVASPYQNLWFREGVVSVPEPSTALLALLGAAGLYFRKRK